MDVVAEHLLRIAKDEGVTLSDAAASAMARQSEGSFRDALSLLDQASVLGGGTIDEEVVDVADRIGSLRRAVRARRTRSRWATRRRVFELVNRLVQEGQDLRHVTNEVLAHFRNLLLAKTAPGQPDLLDVTADEAERLVAQAAKYSAPELARVISLLLAAQTDMRWTTSPRLSLELALIRVDDPRGRRAARGPAHPPRAPRTHRRRPGPAGAPRPARGRGSRLRFRGAGTVGGRSGLPRRRSTVAFRPDPRADRRHPR